MRINAIEKDHSERESNYALCRNFRLTRISHGTHCSEATEENV